MWWPARRITTHARVVHSHRTAITGPGRQLPRSVAGTPPNECLFVSSLKTSRELGCQAAGLMCSRWDHAVASS